MGALAPLTSWTPEDDLVLKNAVEAGASLEALAKGAVQFSRRFTIRELQDRWHALLYDPVISADSSARMIEFERNMPTKSTHLDDAKENSFGRGKRKVESVRTCYYAMRKRICNEPLNMDDFGFLVSPENGCFMNGNNIPYPDGMLRDPLEQSFGFEDTDFGNLHNVYPEVMEDNCLTYGVVGSSRDCTEVGQAAASKELSPLDLYVTHDIRMGDMRGSVDHGCPTLGGNQIPECDSTFGHLQCSSSPPLMSDWRTMGPISGVKVAGNSGARMEDEHTVDAFGNAHDGSGRMTSEFGAVLCETELGGHMPNDLKNTTNCHTYLGDSSNTLLDLARVEDMLFTGDDGRDITDKIDLDGLSSLLLNSPVDANFDANAEAILDELPSTIDAEVPALQESYVDVPSGSSAVRLIDYRSHCTSGDKPVVAAVDPQFEQGRNGVICCSLNTEYPEIPSNEDVILPPIPLPSTSHRRTSSEANRRSFSFPVNPSNQTTEGLRKATREPHSGSHTKGSEMRGKHKGHDNGVKYDVPRSEPISNSRHPLVANRGQGQGTVAKKEASEIVLARQPGSTLAKKSAHVLDRPLQNSVGDADTAADVPAVIGKQEFNVQGTQADSVFLGPVEEPLLVPEGQDYESDEDVPYFSDVESMVLEMDLAPDDHDLYSNSRVTKYQNEEAKRTIIRLEQAAHSYMQRAIASHGAFAVLYGRNSKHYIKKPEVLLGRATGDVFVDIDLGREGRANKISRRQAILKMERDGSFHLKNLGKFSLSVNSVEVYPGQSLKLQSNCLVEIRGIAFIFETNQAHVKKYLDYTSAKAQARDSKGLNS